MKRLTPLYLFVFVFVACNEKASDTSIAAEPQKKESVDYKAVLDETNKQFADAALKGDSAAFVALYHPDAMIYAPNEEAMDARKMASMVSYFPKMGIKSFSLHAKEIYEGKDDGILTEVGTFEMGDGQKTTDKGKYMVVWKKDGDKWKLFRDIWNSDNPPPPPMPAEKKK